VQQPCRRFVNHLVSYGWLIHQLAGTVLNLELVPVELPAMTEADHLGIGACWSLHRCLGTEQHASSMRHGQTVFKDDDSQLGLDGCPTPPAASSICWAIPVRVQCPRGAWHCWLEELCRTAATGVAVGQGDGAVHSAAWICECVLLHAVHVALVHTVGGR
jgi:hypothetical protein